MSAATRPSLLSAVFARLASERSALYYYESMIIAQQITELQDETTRLWHGQPVEDPALDSEPGLLALARRQHATNFILWHTEDEARRPGAGDADLARVKRIIDRTNQLRNDLAEKIDQALLAHLAATAEAAPQAELHSETPGMMMDRLSILSLRIFHTREEMERPDAPEGHRGRNEQRLAILLEQRADLARCLDRLWQQILAGERRFKLYRQLKMYNDPTLNPAVYRAAGRSEKSDTPAAPRANNS